MHSRGTVADMASYTQATYTNTITEVITELQTAVTRALTVGVPSSAIILDPGLGFAKTPAQSIAVLANLPKLVDQGFPVMVGPSRKRFLGAMTGVQLPTDRDNGTIGANVAALMLGATWFRVHAVQANRHALDVAATILESHQ
jgi:dihydropteroate synthase